MALTSAQERFVRLERQKAEYKEWLAELGEAVQGVADEIGVGGYFQDDDGVVYKLVVPGGRWVTYETVGYVRTKREGEDKGTLSIKEAKEAGYEV